MTRHRALTSTLRSVIALLTAVLIALVGATALPAAAFAGENSGKAKGHQSDPPGNGADRSHQAGQAHNSGSTHKSETAPSSGPSSEGAGNSQADRTPAANGGAQGGASDGGKSDQPHQSSGASDLGASDSTGGSSDQGDPKGNNGTIKLAGFDSPNGPGHSSGEGSTRKHPSNDPHLPCEFSVEWFGFDSGVTSTTSFVQHAPTRGGEPQGNSVQLDADSQAGGGSTAGYDGYYTYNLDWEGEPHPKHGYHVKLTTYTPYSQGNDTKHKVFWVEPCETTVEETPPTEETPPGEETPDEETPDEETPDEETPDEETPGEDTPGEDENTELLFVEDSTNPEVLGTQASVRGSQSAQTAPAEVPTAVESGLTGEQWSRSVLPLLAVLLGLATTFVALARRRAPVEADSRD
jgi:hypothetical protein